MELPPPTPASELFMYDGMYTRGSAKNTTLHNITADRKSFFGAPTKGLQTLGVVVGTMSKELAIVSAAARRGRKGG